MNNLIGTPKPAPRTATEFYDAAIDAYESGDTGHAQALASQALAENPQHAGALFMLGSLLLNAGNAAAALPNLEAASQYAPNKGVVWRVLGSAYFALQRWPETVHSLQNAVRAGLNDARILNQLGLALKELGNISAAIAAYRDALALDTHDPDLYNNLAVALNRQHDYVAAIAAYRNAITLDPSRADIWSNLATLYEQANMLDEAEQAVSRGLALAPQQEHLHLIAAKCERRRGAYKAAVLRLKSVLQDERMDANVRWAMEFELGRDYDRLGDADQAYQYFLEGNRQTLQLWPELAQGARHYRREMGAMADFFQTFPFATLRSAAGIGPVPAQNLVFLVGFPRSGTTLLDTILDAHPGISVLEEEPFIDQIIETLGQHPAGYPQALSGLTAADLDEMRTRYWHALEQQLGDKAHTTLVVDKNPFFSAHAALIHLLFPEARFIFALRHPCDVILSCFMQPFGRNPVLANLCDLQTATQLYCLVMDLWLRYRKQLPLKVHELRYEALVENKDGEIRALLDFLELEWAEGLSDHTAHARGRGRIYTPSYHQVIQPVYRDALYRWKRYARHLAPTIETLRPLAETLGYEIET